MEKTSQNKEKRKDTRVLISLPLLLQINENEAVYTGLTVDVSESGLLIQSFKDMPVDTRLNVEVLFPKGFELSNFHGVADVIWKYIYYWEDWEGYLYGLKFTQILDKERLMLKQLLSDSYFMNEAFLFDNPRHNVTSTVKVE
ncbi:MAG: hypothetical protein A2026_19395 [Deltaproteobacteria bacterium RBG_19FT_COMBO_46_12]|nr:MAG: hypothetical protein A2026_19395 [Deltaproteobacteria bacterium RBG_19FT_COMBO_46_12]